LIKWRLKNTKNQQNKELVLGKDKTGKLLYKLTKRKGDRAQINKTRGEKNGITTNTNEIQKSSGNTSKTCIITN
jgi:hypothetical protein